MASLLHEILFAGNNVFILQFTHKSESELNIVLCSVRKCNTNNIMEKNGYVKFDTKLVY